MYNLVNVLINNNNNNLYSLVISSLLVPCSPHHPFSYNLRLHYFITVTGKIRKYRTQTKSICNEQFYVSCLYSRSGSRHWGLLKKHDHVRFKSTSVLFWHITRRRVVTVVNTYHTG